MKITVVLPVFNEQGTIQEILRRVLSVNIEKEIIVVDDGSTDGSREILYKLISEQARSFTIILHPQNLGKGAAIRTALRRASGELVLIQDADLEYNPRDYPRLIAPFSDPSVQVVYGSRNLQANPRSSQAFYWGGRLLTLVANLLYGSSLTDITTGYKIFRTELLREACTRSNGFNFCAEITARILKSGVRIIEVPISYCPRRIEEGKKIRWRDGVIMFWTLTKLRFLYDFGGSRREEHDVDYISG